MWWFVNAVAGVVLALAPLLTAGKSCEPVQEEVTQQRRFEALVEDMNLPCNKLGIGYFEDDLGNRVRGLKAKVDLEMGERMLSIPLTYTLSKFSVSGTPLEGLLQQLGDTLPEKAVTSLILLHYFGADPRHAWQAEFVNFLPTELTNLLYFTTDEIAELQCPPEKCPVVQRVEKMRLELWEIFSALRRHIDAHGDVQYFPAGNSALTWDSFVWAYSLVESRSFKINVTATHGYSLLPAQLEKENTDSGAAAFGALQIMVPFADLFNHHNAFPALQYSYGINDTSQTLDFFADQPYSAGEQVFISYGLHTNSDSLLHYGFVQPNNIYETVGFDVSLDSPENDPLFKQKLKIRETLALDDAVRPSIPLSGDPPELLWTLLRLKFAIAEDFERAGDEQEGGTSGSTSRNAFDPTNATTAGSQRLEFDIVQGLLDNVEELLASYPTTLDEDVSLLRQHQQRYGLVGDCRTVDQSRGKEEFPGTGEITAVERAAALRLQAAMVLRIEIKRILHATILECLHRIALHFDDTSAGASKESEAQGLGNSRRQNKQQAPKDTGATETIEEAMLAHWRRGMHQWRTHWDEWRRDIDELWLP